MASIQLSLCLHPKLLVAGMLNGWPANQHTVVLQMTLFTLMFSQQILAKCFIS